MHGKVDQAVPGCEIKQQIQLRNAQLQPGQTITC